MRCGAALRHNEGVKLSARFARHSLHLRIREGRVAGVYVQVGTTNRRADAELIEELRRLARGEGFDEQPMPGLDSEALDFRAASESFGLVREIGTGPQDPKRRYFLTERGPA